MARSLKMNGIAAEPITLTAGKRSAGETILAKADELGCDLIVKGAYTQSRLRQMIFGGTTRAHPRSRQASGADGALSAAGPSVAGHRKSLRMILPTLLLGRLSTNTITFGTL